MFDVALIVLFALMGDVVFKKLGLPGILGMIATGLILGPSGFDIIRDGTLDGLKEFKTVALIIILSRAGLGISKSTLNRIGGPAIKMGIIPCIIEGGTITLLAWKFFGFQFYEAGMLGFIIAAVSPAVVVPAMLELKSGGFGKKKEVPTLVLAGASLDDVIAITLFGVFAGLGSGQQANWLIVLVGVPSGIILGAIGGALLGYIFVWFFKNFHMRDTLKVIIFTTIATMFYAFSELPAVKSTLPIAALLGIMAIGFVILEHHNQLAGRMAAKFGKIWVFAEILLFVYIGSEVRIDEIAFSSVSSGLAIIVMGLLARSTGVFVSLIGSSLNFKEKIFCVMAYWPKATVQAAIGTVPLTMVFSGKIADTSEQTGQLILAIAVLSILLTAPLGAICIKLFGKKLLVCD
ncbi:MAG: cation:proton antiporter [Rubritalea sp.]|uniref:cation:proton antiporter n=1 Tax=Rubritalea sp. TaxID=2109375 RepID=UPI0032424F03